MVALNAFFLEEKKDKLFEKPTNALVIMSVVY
jgi:hypothetical protein